MSDDDFDRGHTPNDDRYPFAAVDPSDTTDQGRYASQRLGVGGVSPSPAQPFSGAKPIQPSAEPECLHGLDEQTCSLCHPRPGFVRPTSIREMLRWAFDEFGNEDEELVLRLVIAEVLALDEKEDLLLPLFRNMKVGIDGTSRRHLQEDAALVSQPRELASPDFDRGQRIDDHHAASAAVDPSETTDHIRHDSQTGHVGGLGSSPQMPIEASSPNQDSASADFLTPEPIGQATPNRVTVPVSSSHPQTPIHETTTVAGAVSGGGALERARQHEQQVAQASDAWMLNFARRIVDAPVRLNGERLRWGQLTYANVTDKMGDLRKQASGIADTLKVADKTLFILRTTGVRCLDELTSGGAK